MSEIKQNTIGSNRIASYRMPRNVKKGACQKIQNVQTRNEVQVFFLHCKKSTLPWVYYDSIVCILQCHLVCNGSRATILGIHVFC